MKFNDKLFRKYLLFDHITLKVRLSNRVAGIVKINNTF